MIRRLLPLLVLALLAVLAVSCEDEADETPAPPASTAQATQTATATGAAAGASPSGTATATGAPASVTETPAGTAASTETPPPTPSETVASTFFIPTDELPITRFITEDGREVDLPTEVPPVSEYSIGLSGRTELAGRGMLFYYPDVSGGPGFWMRNTHIDLDIAFLDGDGTIIYVTRMQADTLDVHHPGQPYLAAVEAPAGWYEEHGIEVGDRAEFLFDPVEERGDAPPVERR